MLIGAVAAEAGTVTWTDWTRGTTGPAGYAAGTPGGVGVTLTGNLEFIQNGVTGNTTN